MKKNYKYVITSVNNRIGEIILNRPEKRNALNSELVEEIKNVLDQFQKDRNVKIVIIKAIGEAFCAGADLEYLQQLQSNTYEENIEDSNALCELFKSIYKFDKIVIAQVEGHAIAGGAGLAIVCDFIFSVPEAKYGFTEVKIGFVPALVSFFLIRKIGEARSRDLLLSGRLINSGQAFEMGLINEVIPREKINAEVMDVALKLAENTSFESIKLTKQIIANTQHLDYASALKKLTEVNAKARENEDCVKGISTFLNKKPLKW